MITTIIDNTIKYKFTQFLAPWTGQNRKHSLGTVQKFRKKYTVSHMNCVFQALQFKVDVFPPQRPYREIDL